MYAIMALIGFMLLTWAAAVWASYQDTLESQDEVQPRSKVKAPRRRLKAV
jgi:hypothetical protein